MLVCEWIVFCSLRVQGDTKQISISLAMGKILNKAIMNAGADYDYANI